MGRPKLMQGLVDRAIALKRDGLSNRGIICALGIHESMYYRWIGDPKNKLQHELSEGLKRRRRRSSRRCSPRSAPPRCHATSTEPPQRGCSSASASTSTVRPTAGSTKSSFISLAIALVMLANPGADAVVVRWFSNTLRDSVFQQMTWAIATLGLERWFRARIPPWSSPTCQRSSATCSEARTAR